VFLGLPQVLEILSPRLTGAMLGRALPLPTDDLLVLLVWCGILVHLAPVETPRHGGRAATIQLAENLIQLLEPSVAGEVELTVCGHGSGSSNLPFE